MAGQAVVVTITWISGTTLVLTVGAIGAAAKTVRMWFSNLWGATNRQQIEPEPHEKTFYKSAPYHAPGSTHLLAAALGIETADLAGAEERAQAELLSYLAGERMITRQEAQAQLERNALSLRDSYALDNEPTTWIGDEALLLAFLAEELEITVDALQSAREMALEAALTMAVEEGVLSEAQVEDRLLRYRIQRYTDPSALLAEALDITLEELEQRPVELWVAERRLTWRALNARLAEARKDALDQAAEDGALTSEQADRLAKQITWEARPAQGTDDRPTLQYPWPFGFLYLKDADPTLN